MKRPIRIVLADDHVLVRAGMKSLIENFDNCEVVGEAADGQEALRLIAKLEPDLVLMDIAMPKLNGLDATARAVNKIPGLKVVILSMHASRRYVIEAMRAGAAGYLLKHCQADELERAIDTVARGGKYLTPELSEAIVEQILAGEEAAEAGEDFLTTRQREILQLVAEGQSSKEIAKSLNISSRTVDAHRSDIMARLNIHDVTGLVRYAISIGLVAPEI